MDQVIEFVGNHPFLIGSFVLLLTLFVRNETRRGGSAVSAQELVNLVNRENAVIIDVRDKKEFDQGHIVNAVNIPFANLSGRVDELNKYRELPMVVACKQGQHAGSAGTLLRKAGFENISRLTGGIAEWRNQNLPVVKA
ncbi:MAG: rhodanese-like domain-containing protein [Gammaproteobacteria bacterium]|nr:rhodanese-like domain-containing protein [Gammaproteobacteria bacterium]MCZ6853251.1 rhodanese-like domain-containing protein [Gammaproteobacteria bacterium]